MNPVDEPRGSSELAQDSEACSRSRGPDRVRPCRPAAEPSSSLKVPPPGQFDRSPSDSSATATGLAARWIHRRTPRTRRRAQEQRSGESAKNGQVAECHGGPFDGRRSGISDMRWIMISTASPGSQSIEASRDERSAVSFGSVTDRYCASSNVTWNSMSGRSECQTEQYFSRDSSMARLTALGGTSPRTRKCSVALTRRRGSASARAASSRA